MGVADPPPDPFGWVGATVAGKYRVDAVVAEGGFGVVYRAHHLGLDSRVALKCLTLPARLRGPEREQFLNTFVAEGKLLHQLSRETTGIVQALDVGADTSPNGTWTPYLVLEWLDGTTLEDDLAARSQAKMPGRSLIEAIALLEPAARALAIAHQRGIVHRDIKPANLFVAEIGGRRTVKVVDFGIAKVMTEVTSLTRAMQATGASLQAFTPQYGAPEQFDRARYGATGPWTDVFAFALVLVEVLTGRPALDGGDTTQFFISSIHPARRPTPRQCGVHVPDAVEAVMARAVAIESRDRFHSAGDFWDALVAAAAPVSSREAFAATALGQGPPPSKGTELAPPGSLPAASWPKSPSTTSPHVGQAPVLVPPAPPIGRQRRGVVVAIAAGAIGVLAIATVGALALSSHSTPGRSVMTGASGRPSQATASGSSGITRPPPIDITLSCVTSATASSWYEKHPASHAFDENPKTAWNENAPGDGTGQWVEARLKPNTYVDHVDVGGGWSWTTDDQTDLWTLNNSFRTMRVSWDGGSAQVQFDRKTDRGQKKRVNVSAVTAAIRFTAVAVDRGKVDDLCLDDAVIYGSCPLDCSGETSDCGHDLFVQIGGPQSGTAADYAYPGAYDMLRGRPEFAGTRVVETRRGGTRVMGAIVGNRCLATKLTGLVQDRLGISTTTACEKVDVSRVVWSVPQGGLPASSSSPGSQGAPTPFAPRRVEGATVLGVAQPDPDVTAAWFDGFGAYRVAGNDGLPFLGAERGCLSRGLVLCTPMQWRRVCDRAPAIATVKTWTSDVDPATRRVIVRGGGTCAATANVVPDEPDPSIAGLCCSRAIAVRGTDIDLTRARQTNERVGAIEAATDAGNAKALGAMFQDGARFFLMKSATRVEIVTNYEDQFLKHPDLWMVHDSCEALPIEDNVESANCHKLAQQDGKVAVITSRYSWDRTSGKLVGIVDGQVLLGWGALASSVGGTSPP